MDEIDKKILNIIQAEFPVEVEPLRVLGEQIGISEDEVLERIKKLKNDGIIRRIGAIFDTRKLGFASTLCAVKVPEEQLKEFVDVVNSCPGVTHNYLRNHEYNVWFTLIAPTGESLKKSIDEISKKTGIKNILNMSVKQKFKINASFEL